MGNGFAIIIVLIIAITFRVIAYFLDKDRIAEYIEGRGSKIDNIKWTPFGAGWFGEKNARIYSVMYYDKDENIHVATCKTSMFAGVYLTEDDIVQYKRRNDQKIEPIQQEEGNEQEESSEKSERIQIKGIHHLLFSVSNLNKSIEFYKQVFGAKLLIKEDACAYLEIKGLLIRLIRIKEMEKLAFFNTYSHISFSIDGNDYDKILNRLKELNVNIQETCLEHENGKTIYFKDLDGYLFKFSTRSKEDILDSERI